MRNQKPLVSVIIIFLNPGAFIQEAIDSVLAQSYDRWELLLVDDGSTDASTDVALRYAAQHPERIRYLEHEGHQNRGMSASRNLGIRNARGKYFALLDADDVWLPSKLERQVEILESHPETAMVYGPSQYWYSWTRNPAETRSDFMQELVIQTDRLYLPPALLENFLQHEGATPCTCSVLVRRAVAGQIGEFEESFRDMYEDQVFFSKICLQAPIFVSGECNSKYRRHPSATCAVPKTKKQIYSARLRFLSWLENYLTKQNIKDQDVWRPLRKALQAEELRPYRHPRRYRFLQFTKGLTANFERLARVVARWTISPSVRLWLRGR
jgi:glycosyltransferase involved in cell wall biosynthesis